jgi:uncharacterized protein YbjQ (UPF0145 family)
MLLTTTDTLSRPYTEIGLVHVAFRATTKMSLSAPRSVEEQTEKAEERLREKAAGLGADAVIGMRLTNVMGSSDTCVLMGTAIKLGG